MRSSAFIVGSAVTMFAVNSVPALAQTRTAPDTGIADIVVTAQKREENMQKVPISVSALGAEQLEQRGITGLANFLQTPPPSVTLQPFAGSSSLLIVDMRGVTNSDPGQGTAELGTAVYIDDVYLGRAQGLGTELVDPERIEILRGPQGTLFGRNAEGGAVRIVTKKPTGKWGGDVRGSIGNFGARRFETHINLPSIAGFDIKLDYLLAHRGGYTDNQPRVARLDRQRGFGAMDGEGYRAAVRWQPTPDITLDYAYDHSRTRDVYDYEILARPPVGFQPNGPLAPLATFLGTQPLTSIHERVDNSWIPLYNAPFDTRIDGHTVQAEFVLSDALKLRSITSFRETSSVGANQLGGAFTLALLPAAGLPIAALVPRLGSTGFGLDASTRAYAISGVLSYSDVDQSQRSQEFQLIGSMGDIEYVLGAYYFREKVRDIRKTFFSIIYTDPALDNAVGINPFTVGSSIPGYFDQSARSRSYAGFAQATWSPGFAADRLHLTAGLRYTDDRKSFHRSIANGAPVDLNPPPFAEKRWDPAFTVAYDLTPQINIYARYAQAYRAGGVSVRSPTFRPFGAEVNKSYELGFKGDLLGRRLRLNAALFENRISNRQITVQLDPTGNPSVTDTLNAPGVTRIRGVEAEIIAAPAAGLQLSLNYGYLQGRRAASYSTLDPNADIRIQSLPKHSLTVGADYRLNLVGDTELLFHMDYSVASDTPGTGRVRYDAFAWDIERDVANGRITLQNIVVGPARFRAALFGKNLFDSAYPVFTAPGANAVLSPPRTYGLELGASF